jgi:hypothetical protein
MDIRALSCSRFCLAHVYHAEETIVEIRCSGQSSSVRWLEMPLTTTTMLLKVLALSSFLHAEDKVLLAKKSRICRLEVYLPAVCDLA